MSNTNTTKPTKVVTIDEVRFSYAQVWEPRAMMENGQPVGKPKYSVVLLIPKKAKKTIAQIESAIAAAKELGRTSKWKNKIPANLVMPLHDGDEKFEEDEEKYGVYKGMMYVSAKSDNKPKIIGTDGNEIIDKQEFYSGVWGRASVNFFAFDNRSKGVACGLNSLLKTRDDENLGGGASDPNEDFAAYIGTSEDL